MTLDVWSDIACPWCYLGEHRLFAALAERPDLDVTPRWRPFQLQPGLPAEGVPWRAFAERKFGSWERAQAAFAHVAAAAAHDEGVAFDFARLAAAVNTTDAHRLVLFGREHEREWDVADALFRAYFAEGQDVGSADVLLAITEDAGLDPDAARTWLQDGGGREAVEASQAEAQRLGITGVPTFVFDGRYALSGAQPAEALVRVLDEVQARAAA